MPQLNAHHIFSDNGSLCLINIERMAAFLIDDPAIAEILKNSSANPNTTFEDGVREKLEKLELLPAREAKPKKERKSEQIPVRNIALFVTQQCNLRCIYCYGDGGTYGSGGEMTRRTARKAVDWLIEQSQKVKKLGISFFGGEPLLNFPLIKDVVAYARRRGGETGKAFTFAITTNGSLLDDEKIAFFKKHEIVPLLSFDGPKELQDTQRPFKNGKGSYESIVPKIRKLLEAFPESACRATLVGSSDPVCVDNSLREMGFSRRHLAVASRSLFEKEHEGDGYESDLAGMLNKAETDAGQLVAATGMRDTEKLRRLKDSGVLCGFVEQFVNNQKSYFYCSAGRDLAAVSCSGDVYLCHRFVGSEEHRLGDIFSGRLKREPYLTDSLKHRGKCSDCFAKYLCAGGCYHDNMGASGSVFEPDGDRCVLMRRCTELAAAICGRLTEDDRAYLVKENIIEKKNCPMDLF